MINENGDMIREDHDTHTDDLEMKDSLAEKVTLIRQFISKFAYTSRTSSPSKVVTRSHPSTPSRSKIDEDDHSVPSSESSRFKKGSQTPSPLIKRKKPYSEDSESLAGSSSPKKKRGYAPPGTYAHLNSLQDYLKNDLDGTSKCTIRYILIELIKD